MSYAYASYPFGLTAFDFPVNSPVLRRLIINEPHARCPECGGTRECKECRWYRSEPASE